MTHSFLEAIFADTSQNWMQAQQAQQARSNLQYGSRAFSMPIPGGGLSSPYGGPGLTFANPGGSSGHASATAAASAALQVKPLPKLTNVLMIDRKHDGCGSMSWKHGSALSAR